MRPENSEVERLLSDNSKAKKLLGWEPNFKGRDGFKSGLQDTLNWISSRIESDSFDPGLYVK